MSLRFARALPLLATCLCLPLAAQASEAEHVHASQAWIRVLPGDLPAGAYVTLQNDDNQPATLRAVHTDIYASAMLHKSSEEGGTSRMAMVDNLSIPAHGAVQLSPGGYHLMLMKASHPVKPGDKVKVTLTFGDGSTLDADFLARPANATGASD